MSMLANEFDSKGWSVTLIVLYQGAEGQDYPLRRSVRLRQLGIVSAKRNPIFSLRNVGRLMQLRRAIGESCPDLVLSFLDKINVMVLIATAGMGFPVIVSERTDIAQYRIGFLWHSLRYLTYCRAASVVVQTEGIAASSRTLLHRKVRVIPNPVSPPRYSAKRELLGSSPFLISVGRLAHSKGMDILIRSFAQVLPDHPTWSLVILGVGAERPALDRLVASLGIAKSVRFCGWVENPADWLRDADIFVMSSRYEGFSNALCEAMACGCPVIATACSGVGEIVRDGVDGIVVPPEDADAIAAALDILMRNPEMRARMGQMAMDVVSRFGVDQVMSQWEELFNDTVT